MATISECISSANKTVKDLGYNFEKSIKCSNVKSAEFSTIFEIKIDSNITNAESEFKKEVQRINDEIDEVNAQLAKNRAREDDLEARMRECNSDITECNKDIRRVDSDIFEYKRQIQRARDEAQKEEAEQNLKHAKRRKEGFESQRRKDRKEYDSLAGELKGVKSSIDKDTENKNKKNRRLEQVRSIIELI